MTDPKYDHYLVIDLEATCANDGTIPRGEMEIIEIGAVMAHAKTLRPVAEFQSFVRPVRHETLTAFCTKLTSIQQSDVDAAPGFPDALAAMSSWMVPFGSLLFCSWGDYDRRQLQRDCAYHRVSYPLPDHLSLKTEFTRVRGLTKKPGMSQALRSVGLEFDGTHHRGIDDARNIARLLPFILGQR